MFKIYANSLFQEPKCYGFIGGAIRSFSSSDPSVVKKVKSPGLQTALDNSLQDYKSLRTQGNEALGDYISKYLSNVNNYDKWSSQEIGTASDFFNGNVSNRLAQLRASRQQAVNNAATVAGDQALRNVNGSMLTGEGGPSSYDKRLAIGALAPIKAAAAVDNANQERQDYGFVLSGQQDAAGKRMALANADAASGLVPQQAGRSMFGQNLGFLGNMLQADQLNHFYGLKQPSNPWADFADSADQGIMNAASIVSSVSGMMKDGGLVRAKAYAKGGMARKDYKGGGNVRGPGGPTDDQVPAWLSDGEFVMPAKAVKMPGVLPLLEKIRQMALKDSTTPKKVKDAGEGRFALGGEVGAFGMDPTLGMNAGNPVADGIGQAWMDQAATENSPMSSQQPQKKSGGGMGGGGGGGGMSGQAMALQARVDRNLMAQWFPSSSTFGSMAAPEFNIPGVDEQDMPAMFANV
jgi:hypothetical protein